MISSDCRRAASIAMAKAEGRPVSDEEERFAREHSRRCESCCVESFAEGLLRYPGQEPHVEPLDDLARHRWIDEIVEQAEARKDVTARRWKLPKITGTGRWTLPLASAAALLVILIGASLIPRGGRGPIKTRGKEPAVAMQPQARVLMMSGEARADTVQLHAGAEMMPGQVLEVESGRAALELPTGISLILQDQARLRLDKMDGLDIRIFLERGVLVASVLPGRKEPRFGVATSHGVVSVTGTVFSILAAADEVDVKVLRGEVRVSEPGQTAREVRSSQMTTLGSGVNEPLPSNVESALWQEVGMLEMLADAEGVLLNVDSVPSGALVTLEGTALGTTPLSATLRPGHRLLDLTLEGYAPVRERLELAQDEVVSRVFELRPVDEASDRETDKTKGRQPQTGRDVRTAHDLLIQAQALRSFRDWSRAAETYRNLIRQYPDSAEARSSLVSLGLIQLDHLNLPQASLESFDDYLSAFPGGSLAPEAAFGRARALGALGERNAETDALRAFIGKYPQAVQIPEARQRLLKTLSQGGQP